MQRTAELEADRADEMELTLQRKKAERQARIASQFEKL